MTIRAFRGNGNLIFVHNDTYGPGPGITEAEATEYRDALDAALASPAIDVTPGLLDEDERIGRAMTGGEWRIPHLDRVPRRIVDEDHREVASIPASRFADTRGIVHMHNRWPALVADARDRDELLRESGANANARRQLLAIMLYGEPVHPALKDVGIDVMMAEAKRLRAEVERLRSEVARVDAERDLLAAEIARNALDYQRAIESVRNQRDQARREKADSDAIAAHERRRADAAEALTVEMLGQAVLKERLFFHEPVGDRGDTVNVHGFDACKRIAAALHLSTPVPTGEAVAWLIQRHDDGLFRIDVGCPLEKRAIAWTEPASRDLARVLRDAYPTVAFIVTPLFAHQIDEELAAWRTLRPLLAALHTAHTAVIGECGMGGDEAVFKQADLNRRIAMLGIIDATRKTGDPTRGRSGHPAPSDLIEAEARGMQTGYNICATYASGTVEWNVGGREASKADLDAAIAHLVEKR